MLKKSLIVAIILLSLVAAIIYYKLGGSKPLKFSLVSNTELYVTGNYFEGKYNDPKLERLFFEARDRAQKDEEATLVVANYRNGQTNKTIRQFVGSATRTKPQTIPRALELRIFPAHMAVFTAIKAHNFVMPTAESVLEEAKKFAEERGYTLDTLSLETYVSERELRISFPVKKR